MVPLQLIVLALVAVTGLAFVPVLVKFTQANEFTIGLARLLVAVAVMTPIVQWRGGFAGVRRLHLRWLGVIGLVFAIHWLLFFYSIKLATAATASAAVSTYGLQYLVLAWMVNRERIHRLEALAMGVGLLGILVMVPELSLENDTTTGILIGVVAGTLCAVLPLLHQRVPNLGALPRAWGQFTFALLCLLPFWSMTDWRLDGVDWITLVVLGVLCTVFAHGLWIKASTELPAALAGVIHYLTVPLAMVMSALVLDEQITADKVTGAALVVGASLSVVLNRWRLTTRLGRG